MDKTSLKSNLQHLLKFKMHIHFDKAILFLQILLQKTCRQDMMCTRVYSFRIVCYRKILHINKISTNKSQVNYDNPCIQML